MKPAKTKKKKKYRVLESGVTVRRNPDSNQEENPEMFVCLYVSNISNSCGERDIRQLFERYGEIKNERILGEDKNGHPFGIVEYGNPGSVEKAIKDTTGERLPGISAEHSCLVVKPRPSRQQKLDMENKEMEECAKPRRLLEGAAARHVRGYYDPSDEETELPHASHYSHVNHFNHSSEFRASSRYSTSERDCDQESSTQKISRRRRKSVSDHTARITDVVLVALGSCDGKTGLMFCGGQWDEGGRRQINSATTPVLTQSLRAGFKSRKSADFDDHGMEKLHNSYHMLLKPNVLVNVFDRDQVCVVACRNLFMDLSSEESATSDYVMCAYKYQHDEDDDNYPIFFMKPGYANMKKSTEAKVTDMDSYKGVMFEDSQTSQWRRQRGDLKKGQLVLTDTTLTSPHPQYPEIHLIVCAEEDAYNRSKQKSIEIKYTDKLTDEKRSKYCLAAKLVNAELRIGVGGNGQPFVDVKDTTVDAMLMDASVRALYERKVQLMSENILCVMDHSVEAAGRIIQANLAMLNDDRYGGKQDGEYCEIELNALEAEASHITPMFPEGFIPHLQASLPSPCLDCGRGGAISVEWADNDSIWMPVADW